MELISEKLKGVSYMMLPENLMSLIRQGEGLTVEFKNGYYKRCL